MTRELAGARRWHRHGFVAGFRHIPLTAEVILECDWCGYCNANRQDTSSLVDIGRFWPLEDLITLASRLFTPNAGLIVASDLWLAAL